MESFKAQRGGKMMGCAKCSKLCSLVLLVVGVLFLLRDLAIWDFLGIQWWTVLFLLLGLCGLLNSGCKDCQKMRK